ncbi:prepilin-type N-terminal cleavage/methylation domain-containing protein [Candidatus Saganbacteria bacterium]|nr:prepilin-type N-terminal cleavage/methylation domain-containing protein [Candidatus Saganbacteria bacterium]
MNKRAAPAGRQGFTLIELIISIVVVSISFYAVISLFISVAPKSINVESWSKAAFLANRVLEETVAKDFNNISSVAATSFASPFSNFEFQITVDYVTTSEPDVVSAQATPYKRVKVRVWGGIGAQAELVNLVTNYGF